MVTTVGERAVYNNRQQVFSPDRTRLAVIKRDPESGSGDLWVLDVATGNGRITSSTSSQNETALLRERAPVWSPDGSQVAYMRVLGGGEGLYRRASNGEGRRFTRTKTGPRHSAHHLVSPRRARASSPLDGSLCIVHG